MSDAAINRIPYNNSAVKSGRGNMSPVITEPYSFEITGMPCKIGQMIATGFIPERDLMITAGRCNYRPVRRYCQVADPFLMCGNLKLNFSR